MDEEESPNNKHDSEWSLFLQDNKTLEQIDKDVRRTLPDFAFFQLPIPYSPLCPLSTEPKHRKPKKRAINISNSNTGTSVSTIAHSGSTGSFPGPGFAQKQRSIHGSSMDLKRASLPSALTPTLKRRQTVTVMSPRAGKKAEKPGDAEQWHSAIFSSPVGTGTETPLNGFKTPNNHASPIPSRLRGTPATLAEIDNDEEPASLPDYLFSPIPTRRSLFKRVAHLNQDFGSRQHQPHSLQASKSKDSWKKKKQGFKGGENSGNLPLSTSPERCVSDSDDSSDDDLPQDLHWEAIERILFIYAKLNPGVGYVQGMNEILGPLYYLLANDPDEVSRAHAEAESFWLFHLLMAHFRDHFVRSLDRDRTSGIGSTIARMNSRLRRFDEHLWQNLEDKGIAPEYYSFRWLTVLFTQEFEVPDVWRIWDSVLADTGGVERDYDFLLDFGCAMVCNHTATTKETRDIDITRPSIDLRIWNTHSSVSEYHGASSSFERQGPQDMKALTIDGVQNSDRLDHNLEGTDHRSPLFIPRPTSLKKERPSSMSGLDLNGMWLNTNNGSSITSDMLNVKQPSPSSLSVDNYTVGKDSRPQTATWAETFAQFKMRFVGSGSSTDNKNEGAISPETQVAIPGEPIGALSPSVEL
ncbi:hypothetical protein BGX26_003029 [Mortierella sp. AD094]|nr:hypothetical protein BGX26_003029 [Mortierella sp. AD094]